MRSIASCAPCLASATRYSSSGSNRPWRFGRVCAGATGPETRRAIFRDCGLPRGRVDALPALLRWGDAGIATSSSRGLREGPGLEVAHYLPSRRSWTEGEPEAQPQVQL